MNAENNRSPRAQVDNVQNNVSAGEVRLGMKILKLSQDDVDYFRDASDEKKIDMIAALMEENKISHDQAKAALEGETVDLSVGSIEEAEMREDQEEKKHEAMIQLLAEQLGIPESEVEKKYNEELLKAEGKEISEESDQSKQERGILKKTGDAIKGAWNFLKKNKVNTAVAIAGAGLSIATLGAGPLLAAAAAGGALGIKKAIKWFALEGGAKTTATLAKAYKENKEFRYGVRKGVAEVVKKATGAKLFVEGARYLKYKVVDTGFDVGGIHIGKGKDKKKREMLDKKDATIEKYIQDDMKRYELNDKNAAIKKFMKRGMSDEEAEQMFNEESAKVKNNAKQRFDRELAEVGPSMAQEKSMFVQMEQKREQRQRIDLAFERLLQIVKELGEAKEGKDTAQDLQEALGEQGANDYKVALAEYQKAIESAGLSKEEAEKLKRELGLHMRKIRNTAEQNYDQERRETLSIIRNRVRAQESAGAILREGVNTLMTAVGVASGGAAGGVAMAARTGIYKMIQAGEKAHKEATAFKAEAGTKVTVQGKGGEKGRDITARGQEVARLERQLYGTEFRNLDDVQKDAAFNTRISILESKLKTEKDDKKKSDFRDQLTTLRGMKREIDRLEGRIKSGESYEEHKLSTISNEIVGSAWTMCQDLVGKGESALQYDSATKTYTTDKKKKFMNGMRAWGELSSTVGMLMGPIIREVMGVEALSKININPDTGMPELKPGVEATPQLMAQLNKMQQEMSTGLMNKLMEHARHIHDEGDSAALKGVENFSMSALYRMKSFSKILDIPGMAMRKLIQTDQMMKEQLHEGFDWIGMQKASDTRTGGGHATEAAGNALSPEVQQKIAEKRAEILQEVTGGTVGYLTPEQTDEINARSQAAEAAILAEAQAGQGVETSPVGGEGKRVAEVLRRDAGAPTEAPKEGEDYVQDGQQEEKRVFARVVDEVEGGGGQDKKAQIESITTQLAELNTKKEKAWQSRDALNNRIIGLQDRQKQLRLASRPSTESEREVSRILGLSIKTEAGNNEEISQIETDLTALTDQRGQAISEIGRLAQQEAALQGELEQLQKVEETLPVVTEAKQEFKPIEPASMPDAQTKSAAAEQAVPPPTELEQQLIHPKVGNEASQEAYQGFHRKEFHETHGGMDEFAKAQEELDKIHADTNFEQTIDAAYKKHYLDCYKAAYARDFDALRQSLGREPKVKDFIDEWKGPHEYAAKKHFPKEYADGTITLGQLIEANERDREEWMKGNIDPVLFGDKADPEIQALPPEVKKGMRHIIELQVFAEGQARFAKADKPEWRMRAASRIAEVAFGYKKDQSGNWVCVNDQAPYAQFFKTMHGDKAGEKMGKYVDDLLAHSLEHIEAVHEEKGVDLVEPVQRGVTKKWVKGVEVMSVKDQAKNAVMTHAHWWRGEAPEPPPDDIPETPPDEEPVPEPLPKEKPEPEPWDLPVPGKEAKWKFEVSGGVLIGGLDKMKEVMPDLQAKLGGVELPEGELYTYKDGQAVKVYENGVYNPNAEGGSDLVLVSKDGNHVYHYSEKDGVKTWELLGTSAKKSRTYTKITDHVYEGANGEQLHDYTVQLGGEAGPDVKSTPLSLTITGVEGQLDARIGDIVRGSLVNEHGEFKYSEGALKAALAELNRQMPEMSMDRFVVTYGEKDNRLKVDLGNITKGPEGYTIGATSIEYQGASLNIGEQMRFEYKPDGTFTANLGFAEFSGKGAPDDKFIQDMIGSKDPWKAADALMEGTNHNINVKINLDGDWDISAEKGSPFYKIARSCELLREDLLRMRGGEITVNIGELKQTYDQMNDASLSSEQQTKARNQFADIVIQAATGMNTEEYGEWKVSQAGALMHEAFMERIGGMDIMERGTSFDLVTRDGRVLTQGDDFVIVKKEMIGGTMRTTIGGGDGKSPSMELDLFAGTGEMDFDTGIGKGTYGRLEGSVDYATFGAALKVGEESGILPKGVKLMVGMEGGAMKLDNFMAGMKDPDTGETLMGVQVYDAEAAKRGEKGDKIYPVAFWHARLDHTGKVVGIDVTKGVKMFTVPDLKAGGKELLTVEGVKMIAKPHVEASKKVLGGVLSLKGELGDVGSLTSLKEGAKGGISYSREIAGVQTKVGFGKEGFYADARKNLLNVKGVNLGVQVGVKNGIVRIGANIGGVHVGTGTVGDIAFKAGEMVIGKGVSAGLGEIHDAKMVGMMQELQNAGIVNAEAGVNMETMKQAQEVLKQIDEYGKHKGGEAKKDLEEIYKALQQADRSKLDMQKVLLRLIDKHYVGGRTLPEGFKPNLDDPEKSVLELLDKQQFGDAEAKRGDEIGLVFEKGKEDGVMLLKVNGREVKIRETRNFETVVDAALERVGVAGAGQKKELKRLGEALAAWEALKKDPRADRRALEGLEKIVMDQMKKHPEINQLAIKEQYGIVLVEKNKEVGKLFTTVPLEKFMDDKNFNKMVKVVDALPEPERTQARDVLRGLQQSRPTRADEGMMKKWNEHLVSERSKLWKLIDGAERRRVWESMNETTLMSGVREKLGGKGERPFNEHEVEALERMVQLHYKDRGGVPTDAAEALQNWKRSTRGGKSIHLNEGLITHFRKLLGMNDTKTVVANIPDSSGIGSRTADEYDNIPQKKVA